MNRLLLLSVIFLPLFFGGCASVKIVPQPTGGAVVSSDEQTLMQRGDGVEISIKLRDAILRPSPANQNYCSFWVTIANERDVRLPAHSQDFVLVDAQDRQYPAVDPQQLVDLLKPEIPYLIPYPYVGFYYIDDAARSQAINELSSNDTYFPARRPEYITQDALPVASVLPDTHIEGAIYFAADLRSMTSFEIRYLSGALAGQKSRPFVFHFSVEKN